MSLSKLLRHHFVVMLTSNGAILHDICRYFLSFLSISRSVVIFDGDIAVTDECNWRDIAVIYLTKTGVYDVNDDGILACRRQIKAYLRQRFLIMMSSSVVTKLTQF